MASKTINPMEERIPDHCTLQRGREFGIIDELHKGPPVHSSVGLAAHLGCHAPRERSLPPRTRTPDCRSFESPLLRSSEWDDRRQLGLQGAQTSPGWSSKSTVGRLFRSSRPRWGARPPERAASEPSLSGSTSPVQQAGPRNFLKWREGSRQASGRLLRSPPDTPCAVPRTPGARKRVPPLAPAPTPVAPRREATLLARPAAPGDHARAPTTYSPRS